MLCGISDKLKLVISLQIKNQTKCLSEDLAIKPDTSVFDTSNVFLHRKMGRWHYRMLLSSVRFLRLFKNHIVGHTWEK